MDKLTVDQVAFRSAKEDVGQPHAQQPQHQEESHLQILQTNQTLNFQSSLFIYTLLFL